jgi:outer membrane protein
VKIKKILLILILLFIGIRLEAASLIKVAYVDISQVFDQFKETKIVTNKLNKEIEAEKKEIDRRQKEIEKLEKQLKEAIMLSEQEKARREAVILQKKKELQDYANKVKTDLLKKEQEQTQRIIKIIYGVIENIAVKEGISLVVDKSMVLFGTEEIDLTQRVIDILNRRK